MLFRSLFTALFGTGCRIGEMIGLRWEDLDYENKTISINHAAIYRVMENGKSEFHISSPKTEAGIRTIPMMQAVEQAFKDEYEAQKETVRAVSAFASRFIHTLVIKFTTIKSVIALILWGDA